MRVVERVSDAVEEPCRCPKCSFSYVETMNTKAVAALVYGMVALLMAYLLKQFDEIASFSILLTAIFAFFYFAMSQVDIWQRKNGA